MDCFDSYGRFFVFSAFGVFVFCAEAAVVTDIDGTVKEVGRKLLKDTRPRVRYFWRVGFPSLKAIVVLSLASKRLCLRRVAWS